MLFLALEYSDEQDRQGSSHRLFMLVEESVISKSTDSNKCSKEKIIQEYILGE